MPRAEQIEAVVREHVSTGNPPGAAWAAQHGDRTTTGSAGTFGPDDSRPVRPDTLFRLSSVTKPIVAAAAWTLLDDGTLDLEAPVTRWLPELAGQRVMRDPAGPLDDTVPAERDITVGDVLTLRLGLGMDFAGPFPGPVLAALGVAGLQAGPPAPQTNPDPDTWIRTLASVPLSHQPGSRWLYHTGSEVLGVLIARAADAPLPHVLTERVLAPVGMTDTAFSVGPDKRGRLGPLWSPPGADGGRTLYDPEDGQWTTPPAFPNGGDGLVSSVGDLLAFTRMLRAGGVSEDGTRVISEDTLRNAVSSHTATADSATGWGLGLGVLTADLPDGRRAGSYGWDGGLGSLMWVDPASDVTGILLLNQTRNDPALTPVDRAFVEATWDA